MLIQTTRFGEIEADPDKLILFADGLPGFSTAKRFVVLPHRSETGHRSPFKWLQCVEEPALALPVVNPWQVQPDYAPTIPGGALLQLGIADAAAQARLYAVVAIPANDPCGATVNLVAPLLINKETRRGLQVLLSQERYGLRMPLFAMAAG